SISPPLPISPLFPYTTLFRSSNVWMQVANTTSVIAMANSTDLDRRDQTAPIMMTRMKLTTVAARLPASPMAMPKASSATSATVRSEEHTSELQSPYDLVCRLL